MRFYYFLALIGLIACNSGSGDPGNTSNDIDSLRDTVLAIHDEVMPKMSQLTSLQSQLSDKLKSLKSDENIDMDVLKLTNETLGQLNRAESAMWDWMDGFSQFESTPDEGKRAFLLNQKSSAESMRDMVLNSIQAADKFIKEHPIKNNNEEM